MIEFMEILVGCCQLMAGSYRHSGYMSIRYQMVVMPVQLDMVGGAGYFITDLNRITGSRVGYYHLDFCLVGRLCSYQSFWIWNAERKDTAGVEMCVDMGDCRYSFLIQQRTECIAGQDDEGEAGVNVKSC